MHIDRVYGNQRRAFFRVRQNMLINRPWLNKRVVSREQQNSGKSIAVTETCNAHQFIDISGRLWITRYSRKYAKLAHFHRSWTAFAELQTSGRRNQLFSVERRRPNTRVCSANGATTTAPQNDLSK